MRPSWFVGMLVLAGCRFGFDATGDGGLPACTPSIITLDVNTATQITLCAGTNIFLANAPVAATIDVALELPANLLSASSMSLVAPDQVAYATPIWTAAGIETHGLVTTAGDQRITIDADLRIDTRITITTRSAQGNVYYIAPSGNDSNNGTLAAPFRSWPFALTQLFAGDTLIAEDGEWSAAFGMDCTAGNHQGTAAMPITVVAHHPRRAHLSGSTAITTARWDNCVYWIIDGLHLSSFDAGNNAPGAVLQISSGDHVIVRNVIAHNPNGCGNNHAIEVLGAGTTVTIEDTEVYNFPRAAMLVTQGSITLQRNYVNSRNTPTSCGPADGYPTRGNEGFYCYSNGTPQQCLFSNLLAENVAGGIESVDAGSLRITGSLVRDAYFGVFQGSLVGPPLLNTPSEIDNVACLDCDVGIWIRGVNANIRSTTVVEGTPRFDSAYGSGIAADEFTGPGNGNTTFRNVLALDNVNYAFNIQNQGTLLVDYANAIGSLTLYRNAVEPIADAAGDIRHSMTTAVTGVGNHDGDCLVYVPATSNMHGAGEAGGDIGANIVYRTEDGVLTDRKLWNQRTGQFPCGAIVPGINDIPGASCFDAHERFRVGVAGCAIP